MSRPRALALTALVLVSAVALAAGPVGGAASSVVAIDTSTSPDRPAPGDTVTISTTVTNPEAATDDYQLRSVEVRETTEDNSTLYNESDEETTLSPGESTTRDLAVDIEESGERTFVLHVQVLSGGDVLNFERNVTVTAGQNDPALALSAGSVGSDGEATFGLAVSNARSNPIRAVTVDVDAPGVQFDEERRVVSQLESGAEATLQYPASGVTPGEKTVTADVSYTTSDGEYRTVTRELTTTVDRVENPGDVSLTGIDVSSTDGGVAITGQANNVGETNVSAVAVSIDDSEYSLGDAQSSAFVGTLGVGASSEFDIDATVPDGVATATIPLTVTYRVGGQQVNRTLTVREDFGASGNITLTGLRIEQTGDRLTVRGSASNLGTANASAVTVAVGDGDAVAPAQSQSSYFVGTVQESDFKSFQVDARLTGDTNETVSVPIEISYRVDGQRITTTRPVPYTPQSTGTGVEQPQRDSSIPIALAGALVLVLLAGGLAYRRYR